MKNIVQQSIPALIRQGTQAREGAQKLEVEIGLLQNKAVSINAETEALVDAVMAAGQANVELTNRRNTVRTLAATGRGAMMLGRDLLKPVLGNEYSQSWDMTGLVNSLAISESFDAVQDLLLPFGKYFELNPEHEVPNKGVSADHYKSLLTDLSAARLAVREQQSAVDKAMGERDVKANALRKRMRGLIAELSMLIDDLDRRWGVFGFNKPGADETPDVPEGVTVTLIGPTAAAIKWNPAARGAYYRIWKKVDGVDAELIAVGSPADLDFTLENLPANSTIQIAVSAVNNGGESEPCQAITITTH